MCSLPKATFFNLANDKRQLLIEALEKEFSRVPLYDASISNIVKAANIPRGSFYQYFEDKEDAYFFLLNELVKNNKNKFFLCLSKSNGDLFDALIEMYSITIKELSTGENFNFLRNALLNMTHEIESSFNEIFTANESVDQFRHIGFLINKNKLNVNSDKELYHLMKIVTTVTIRNLIEKLAHNIPEQEAVNNYLIEMEMLRNGLYKN